MKNLLAKTIRLVLVCALMLSSVSLIVPTASAATVLGIESSAYYGFNNTNHTVNAPIDTPASVFYSRINLYANHTGVLLDANDVPLANDAVIQRGVGMKYRITFDGSYVDYTLVTEYAIENFDSFAGKTFNYGGTTSWNNYSFAAPNTTTVTTAKLEGIADNGNNLIRFYSAAGSGNMTLRRTGITQAQNGTNFVITLDMKTDSLSAVTSIVTKYTNKSGTAGQFYNLIDYKTDGTIIFGGVNIGTYEKDKWYRLTAVVDLATTKCIVYMNGNKVINDTAMAFLNNISYFTDIILTHNINSSVARNTWMDNFSFYQIYNNAAFDPMPMQSTVTSTQVTIGSNNVISNYGNVTVTNFLAMLSKPAGATAVVYANDGVTVIGGSEQVTSGMKLKVTSQDTYNTTTYTLGVVDANALNTQIMPIRYNRDAMATITMDDGYPATSAYMENQFITNDLRGSTVIISDWLNNNSATKQYFQNLVTRGRWDIGSHSKSHPNLTTVSTDTARLTAEIVTSKQELQAMFPEQDIITFTAPNNAADAAVTAMVKQNYWAMRLGTRTLNSLTPTEDQYYALNVKAELSNEAPNAATMNGWIDSAIAGKQWLVEMWHGVAEYDPGSYLPVSETITTPHLQYMGQKQREGKLWVATFTEAVQYTREHQSAFVLDNGNATSRSISLTDNLPDLLFDYPLTLKTEVPATWTYATVTQGANAQMVSAVDESGKKYIYYDAVPDKGSISIVQSGNAPAADITELTISTATNVTQPLMVGEATVSVTAATQPATNANEGSIEWYVNGVRQFIIGKTFSYTPAASGAYGIIAKATSSTGATVYSNVINFNTFAPRQITNITVNPNRPTSNTGNTQIKAIATPIDNLRAMYGDRTNYTFGHLGSKLKGRTQIILPIYDSTRANPTNPPSINTAMQDFLFSTQEYFNFTASSPGTVYVISSNDLATQADTTKYKNNYATWTAVANPTLPTPPTGQSDWKLIPYTTDPIAPYYFTKMQWASDSVIGNQTDIANIPYYTPYTYAYKKLFEANDPVSIPVVGNYQINENMVVLINWDETTEEQDPPSANAKLSSLTYTPNNSSATAVNGFAAAYDGGTYTVVLADGTASVSLDGVVADTGKASIAYDKTSLTSFPGTITATVTAQDGSKKTYTVYFTFGGYLINDTFDTHGSVGTVIGTNLVDWKQSSNRADMRVSVAADPLDTNNKVAKYIDDNVSQRWPYMRKEVSVAQPFVISGKVYLTHQGTDNNGTKFYISANDKTATATWTPVSDQKFIHFRSDGKIAVGGTDNFATGVVASGKWQKQKWIRFDLVVTPNTTTPAQSSVTAVIAGGVVDNNGNPAVLTITNNAVDLTNAKLTNGSIHVDFASNLVQWFADDAVYLDDVKVYQAQSNFMAIANNTNVTSSVTVHLKNELNSATFNQSKVNVMAGTTKVTPSNIVLDPMKPNAFTIVFNPGILTASTTYTVSLDQAIKDVAGSAITSTATFTTDASIPPAIPSVTVDDIANTIVGLNLSTMEYAISLDGGATFTGYKTEALPSLAGSKMVKVRVKAVGQTPAGVDAILTFTPNAGDVSGDGAINIADAIMAAEIAVGYSNYTADQILRANVSSKTDMTVDISDLVLMIEHIAQPSNVFPVELTD